MTREQLDAAREQIRGILAVLPPPEPGDLRFSEGEDPGDNVMDAVLRHTWLDMDARLRQTCATCQEWEARPWRPAKAHCMYLSTRNGIRLYTDADFGCNRHRPKED